jgi:hypothetical protein
MPSMKRRSFLAAATLAPVAAALRPRSLSAQKPKPGDSPTESFDPWIEVHAPNLAHNTREVARVADAMLDELAQAWTAANPGTPR